MNEAIIAGGIEQPTGHHSVAEAGRKGVEPLIIEVGYNTVWEHSAPTVTRPIEHIAEADHKSAAELIIAADLTATGKAGIVCRDFAGSATQTRVAKWPADVSADVATGPRSKLRPLGPWFYTTCRPRDIEPQV